MRRRVAIVSAICCIASPAATASSQTQTAWAKRADAICAREFTKFHAAVLDGSRNPPGTNEEWARWVDRMIEPMARLRREVAALPRPAKGRRLIKSLLSSLDLSLSELEQARKGVLEGDRSAYDEHMQRSGLAAQRANAIFARLGAFRCARG